MPPECPSCGSTDATVDGYDRNADGHLITEYRCGDCDDCWDSL
jgi:transposase-like protein